MRTRPEKNIYRVLENIREAPDVCTLRFTTHEGAETPFLLGQFINVFFPETNTPEGKAYSISCAPGGGALSITVKKIGVFSGKLCALAKGDTFFASAPYGFFRPEYETSALVLFAGGIGITPFRGIIQSAMKQNPNRKITLLHSVRKNHDAVFHDEFLAFEKEHANFHTLYFVTREVPSIPRAAPRRITPDRDVPPDAKKENTEYLICGSIDFTSSLWKSLQSIGVPEDALYTEAFFSH